MTEIPSPAGPVAALPLPSKNSLLHHHMWLRAAIQEAGAEALLSFDTYEAVIRRGAAYWMMYPKFLAELKGARQYVHTLSPEVFMFAGWLPYRQKNWPAAADKLVFKETARKLDLLVPAHAVAPSPALAEFIVKRPKSSFGAEIRGPYRQSQQPPPELGGEEFFEQFIAGRLLKVWFWNHAPLCIEMDRLPAVVGNGVSTIREMVLNRAQRLRRYPQAEREQLLESVQAVLRFHGTDLDAVLPKDKKQVVEFRYGSDLMLASDRTLIDVAKGTMPDLVARLNAIGMRLQHAIPSGIRHNTLYTVDAILDDDANVWLLEMNSSPSVHPLAYPAILRSVMLG